MRIANDTLKLSELGAVAMGTTHKAAIRTLLSFRTPVPVIRKKLILAGYTADESDKMIKAALINGEW
jgi:hypothetical protein